MLIPVYEWKVEGLVKALVAQQTDWPGPVEILLFDDGSREEIRVENRPLQALPGVRYKELAQNVGRSAVRNQLAAAAKHEWLLLLDNDSLLPDQRFLGRYAEARHQASVLIGGTCYAATPPSDPALLLRWQYGQAREARPAAVRQRAPHHQLAVNNALIEASILRRFPFNERLTEYGHEDTWFGEELAVAQIPIRHLDNPVLHNGLEPAAAFLHKSEQAVRNLAAIFRESGRADGARLLLTAQRLHRLGLAPAARRALGMAEPALRRQLLSAAPRLPFFDLLKLHWLLRELA